MPDSNPWKPDPRDTRIPIGAPDSTILMHREHIYRLAPLGMPDHCRDMYQAVTTVARRALANQDTADSLMWEDE